MPPGPKRARDHWVELRSALSVRRVYADLDGTLLGPGGSLFSSPHGPTSDPALAVAALLEAGVALVLVSGRTRIQVREVARVVGAAGYVAELGGVLVLRERGEEVVVTNRGLFAGQGTPYEGIERSGAAGVLLEAYPGRLEPHAPWSSLPREGSMLFRGNVPVADAGRLLEASGYGWLELLDNGIIASPPGRFPGLEVRPLHAYHLVPRGVSKAAAVGLDRARAGLDRRECVAVGDSPTDVAMAGEVGAVFLVANGAEAVSGLELPPNAYLVDRSHGEGFADAVLPFVAPEAGA